MSTTSNGSFLFLLPFLLLLIIVQGDSGHNNHDDYFKCLQSQTSNSMSDIIYTPKNSSYLSILQSTEQNLRAASTNPLKPIAILTPLHEFQIQAAIICAKKHGIQIRTRSGGHDYEGLSFISRIDFIIVDLRNFSSILIDSKDYTAWVQSGATLGEVYYKVAKENRTLGFVAGGCPTVGVGGHFSGGGYSMMSRKFGMAIDHIIDAKLIDVNGQILDRQSMGEDLFWAIRGGGGASFGIIIAWKINLVFVPENVTVFSVTRTLEQNATQLVHKWQYIADKIDQNLVMRIVMTSVNSSQTGKKTVRVSFISLFLGGVNDLLALMQHSFPELGLIKEDCSEMSWIESRLYLTGYLKGKSIDVLLSRKPFWRYHFKGKSDYVKQPISEKGLRGMWEILMEEDTDGGFQLQFSPYGGRLSEISPSATPFPHRAGKVYMIHYMLGWYKDSKEESTRHINWIRRLYEYMSSYVSKSPRAAYLNYRDLDLGVNIEGNSSYEIASIWGTKYFENNFDRLVQVKTKVDPSNFFRNEQSIPPFSQW